MAEYSVFVLNFRDQATAERMVRLLQGEWQIACEVRPYPDAGPYVCQVWAEVGALRVFTLRSDLVFYAMGAAAAWRLDHA